jgi:hypothetical protein
MKQSLFRAWLQNIWLANADERKSFGFDPITLSEYFRRYKWWLKREYKFQRKSSK